MTCAPSDDSDQSGYPPSLIRVFAVRLKKHYDLSYPLSTQQRLWSDWADAQADLSFRCVHMPPCLFCHVVILKPHLNPKWLHIVHTFGNLSTSIHKYWLQYCKFSTIRENFIFANIRKFDPLANSRFSRNICLYGIDKKCHSSQILIDAN